MSSSIGPESGWYLDPQVPEQERWWNGQDWTDHTRLRVSELRTEASNNVKPRRLNSRLVLFVLIPVLLIATLTIALFSTARRWEKTDVAASDVKTYDFIFGEIKLRPTEACSIGIQWSECIAKHYNDYNKWCANSSQSESFCNGLKKTLGKMDKLPLSSHPKLVAYVWPFQTPVIEESDEQFLIGYEIEHGEATPAITHTAICYFGVFGECT